MSLKLLSVALLFYSLQSVYAADIEIKRNVSYSAEPAAGTENLLDVYYPADVSRPKDVLVFIHGGSWNSGKKKTYWWLGRNFAREGVVAVVINYSLSPAYRYEKMASDCAQALAWVAAHAGEYGGNSKRIFVMGHSAGAHLAALIHSDPRYFQNAGAKDPIRGLILNDAFGLDMYEYLGTAPVDEHTDSFLTTFSTDQEQWKAGSPLYYLEGFKTPVLLFVGEKTYPAIQLQSGRLQKSLDSLNVKAELQVIPGKKHVAMIAQMIFKGNLLYDYILDFMRDN